MIQAFLYQYIILTMTNIINAKTANKFYCQTCYLKCSKLSNYNTHILTPKHKRLTNPNQKNAKNADTKIYKCDCGKEYKHHSSLCKHKNKCNYKEKEDKLINISETDQYKNLVFKLITENQEFKQEMFKENQELRKQLVDQQKQMTELIPQIGNNNNNHNTINNKQKFNINVFLNEKCKDAISMDQFIDKIEVSMKNLLTTKDKGLGQGLTNIIIDNMNKLSLYERPMHCTDKKREILYVKNHEWEKDEKKEQIHNLLDRVEEKQMKNIEKWTKKHPNYRKDENLQKEYMDLVKGCTTPIEECKEKTIKSVCDVLYVEK